MSAAMKLEPCVFCGKSDFIEASISDHYMAVECASCGASGPIELTRGLMAAAWNRRATPPQGELSADADRILRASVPDRWKSCTSAIGAVQSYIAELEEAQGELSALPELSDAQIDEMMKLAMPGTRPSACFRKFARDVAAHVRGQSGYAADKAQEGGSPPLISPLIDTYNSMHIAVAMVKEAYAKNQEKRAATTAPIAAEPAPSAFSDICLKNDGYGHTWRGRTLESQTCMYCGIGWPKSAENGGA